MNLITISVLQFDMLYVNVYDCLKNIFILRLRNIIMNISKWIFGWIVHVKQYDTDFSYTRLSFPPRTEETPKEKLFKHMTNIVTTNVKLGSVATHLKKLRTLKTFSNFVKKIFKVHCLAQN